MKRMTTYIKYDAERNPIAMRQWIETEPWIVRQFWKIALTLAVAATVAPVIAGWQL